MRWRDNGKWRPIQFTVEGFQRPMVKTTRMRETNGCVYTPPEIGAVKKLCELIALGREHNLLSDVQRCKRPAA